MRKIIGLTLAFVLIVCCFSGCGQADPIDSTADDPTSVTTENDPSATTGLSDNEASVDNTESSATEGTSSETTGQQGGSSGSSGSSSGSSGAQSTGSSSGSSSGVVTPSSSPVVAEGKCTGTAGRWRLTADGVFTLYGNARPENRNVYTWDTYKDQIKKVVVESGITHIPANAFNSCKNLTSVTMADSVESIGAGAFHSCSALPAITIPPKVQKFEENTFAGCSSLTDLRFASGSQFHTLDESTLSGTAITEFVAPPNLKTIASKAFYKHDKLESVILDGSVETIGGDAFFRCYYLKKVVLGSSIKSVNAYAFSECGIISHYESYASSNINLSHMNNLRTVIIGGNVTELPSMRNCPKLSSVTVTAQIQKIEANQFSACPALTSFTIPSTVTAIDSRAFYNTGIQQITIPAAVRSMGIEMFKGSALKEITFLGDPPEFRSNITDDVFAGLGTITAYYPADNPAWTEDVLQNYGATEIIWVAK